MICNIIDKLMSDQRGGRGVGMGDMGGGRWRDGGRGGGGQGMGKRGGGGTIVFRVLVCFEINITIVEYAFILCLVVRGGMGRGDGVRGNGK